MDAEWSFLGFISNLAARIQNNGGPINVPLRYFRLVTSLIAACQVKWGPIRSEVVLRNTPIFLRHCLYRFGDPAAFLLINSLFSTNCDDDAKEDGRGRTRWLPFYNTLASAFSARSRTGQAQGSPDSASRHWARTLQSSRGSQTTIYFLEVTSTRARSAESFEAM